MRARAHPLWLAYMLHRLSGLGLGLFLPFHFWLLSYAIRNPTQLDAALAITANPIVKLAEFGLVFLLALHILGGLRLMAFEWLHWRGWQKSLAAGAAALSFMIATLFLMQAI